MTDCPNCGREVNSGEVRCPNCGVELTPSGGVEPTPLGAGAEPAGESHAAAPASGSPGVDPSTPEPAGTGDGDPPSERHGSANGPLIVLAVGAIALLALLGAGAFLLLGGDDEDESGLPDGAVAFVEEAPDGSVSAEELDRSRVQVASTQGLDEVPPEGSEPRVYVDGAALSDLLLDRWVRGEAAERDIEVSDDDVTAEIERVVEREFDGDESSFEDFLSENGFSEEEARNRIELQILSERIQEEVLGDEEGDARTDAVTAFQEEFFARWRARTICAEEIAIDRCSNGPEVADPEGEAPQPQPGEPQPQPGEPEPQPGE